MIIFLTPNFLSPKPPKTKIPVPKKTNIFLLSLSFLFFTILWVFPFLGFGSPVALLGGFILGKWLGVIVVVFGLSIGDYSDQFIKVKDKKIPADDFPGEYS